MIQCLVDARVDTIILIRDIRDIYYIYTIYIERYILDIYYILYIEIVTACYNTFSTQRTLNTRTFYTANKALCSYW